MAAIVGNIQVGIPSPIDSLHVRLFVSKILRHVPLIRFKYGANQSGSAVHASKESKGDSKPITGTSSSKSVQKSAPLECSETPKNYRRRPLTQDEIDLITANQSSLRRLVD